MSDTDKLRKPHRDTSGPDRPKPTWSIFPSWFCALSATVRTWQSHLGHNRPSTPRECQPLFACWGGAIGDRGRAESCELSSRPETKVVTFVSGRDESCELSAGHLRPFPSSHEGASQNFLFTFRGKHPSSSAFNVFAAVFVIIIAVETPLFL